MLATAIPNHRTRNPVLGTKIKCFQCKIESQVALHSVAMEIVFILCIQHLLFQHEQGSIEMDKLWSGMLPSWIECVCTLNNNIPCIIAYQKSTLQVFTESSWQAFLVSNRVSGGGWSTLLFCIFPVVVGQDTVAPNWMSWLWICWCAVESNKGQLLTVCPESTGWDERRPRERTPAKRTKRVHAHERECVRRVCVCPEHAR